MQKTYKKKFYDARERMRNYNTLDTAVKCDEQLFKISNSVKNMAIYCDEFEISEKTFLSLKKNNNCVIGTGKVGV